MKTIKSINNINARWFIFFSALAVLAVVLFYTWYNGSFYTGPFVFSFLFVLSVFYLLPKKEYIFILSIICAVVILLPDWFNQHLYREELSATFSVPAIIYFASFIQVKVRYNKYVWFLAQLACVAFLFLIGFNMTGTFVNGPTLYYVGIAKKLPLDQLFVLVIKYAKMLLDYYIYHFNMFLLLMGDTSLISYLLPLFLAKVLSKYKGIIYFTSLIWPAICLYCYCVLELYRNYPSDPIPIQGIFYLTGLYLFLYTPVFYFFRKLKESALSR